MAAILAELSRSESNDLVFWLFVLLGFVAFAVAIWLVTLHNYIGAAIAAVIGVVVLLVAT